MIIYILAFACAFVGWCMIGLVLHGFVAAYQQRTYSREQFPRWMRRWSLNYDTWLVWIIIFWPVTVPICLLVYDRQVLELEKVELPRQEN